MLSVLWDMLREEGITGWYSWFSAMMLNTFSTHMSLCFSSAQLTWAFRSRVEYTYFFLYSIVRMAYMKHLALRLPKGSKLPPLSIAAELALGAVADNTGVSLHLNLHC